MAPGLPVSYTHLDVYKRQDQDQELAVLGAPRTQLVSVAERQVDGFEWVSASDVADLLAPSFYPEPVSAEFLDRLTGAYADSLI